MEPIIGLYNTFLSPALPSLRLPYTFLDIAAALRLCLILRQLRIAFAEAHEPDHHEHRSWARDVFSTLTVVFGGEAIFLPFLAVTPAWLISPMPFALFILAQSIVDFIPGSLIPAISWKTELPLSFVDGFSRTFLLCDLIPPVILRHSDPMISNAPWTLILGSVAIANGGFFLTSLFSMLYPTPISMRTPPELLPFGWLTLDLWVAPLITMIYTFLTGAQPVLQHVVLPILQLGQVDWLLPDEMPLGHKEARSICVMILTPIFVTRTLINFGPKLSLTLKREPADFQRIRETDSINVTIDEGKKKKRRGHKTKTQ